MECSPPGSSVHGILQARILAWVAMPSSRGSFQPRNRTCVSWSSALAGGFFTTVPPGKLLSTESFSPKWQKVNHLHEDVPILPSYTETSYMENLEILKKQLPKVHIKKLLILTSDLGAWQQISLKVKVLTDIHAEINLVAPGYHGWGWTLPFIWRKEWKLARWPNMTSLGYQWS